MVAVVLLVLHKPHGMVKFLLRDSRTQKHQYEVVLGSIL